MASLAQTCCVGRLVQCSALARAWWPWAPALSCAALPAAAGRHRRPAPTAARCYLHTLPPSASSPAATQRTQSPLLTPHRSPQQAALASALLQHSAALLHTSTWLCPLRTAPLRQVSPLVWAWPARGGRGCAGQRWSSSDAGGPDLMAVPRVVFPTMLKTLRRWFLVNFVIRPYLDHGFTMQAFMTGAKQAMLVLSERLSRGDLASLQGLVTPEALAELQRSLPRLSRQQRAQLRLHEHTIGPFMACEVGMIIEEEGDVQRRWVEIIVCAHVHPAFGRAAGAVTQLEAEQLTVCNYRFIRDYTRGVHDSWTVNLINHFKPFTRGSPES